MFKKKLGISIYPEKLPINETKDYISLAKKYGFTKIFMSFLQFRTVEEFKKNKDIYFDVIRFAKKNDFYVVVDIADLALKATGSNFKDLSFFIELGVDCLRLDSPLLPSDVAFSTHRNKIDIQVNASNNDHFIDNILDYKPVVENLYACHNFYPQKNTGLGWEYFIDSSRRFYNKGIHLSAFVSSEYGTKGPQMEDVKELVTVERHRFKPIRTQAKELWATGYVSDIYIGNQPAKEDELAELSIIDNTLIELDIVEITKISPLEREILYRNDHFCRGDINENYIRSTMPRIYYQGKDNIKPIVNNKKSYNRGDILIINNNDKNYQYELIVILKDDFKNLGKEVNHVASVNKYDLDLIEFVKSWTSFIFKKTK
ncbi:MupG family TIM beta-alpha barrel fold protein [Spiroplasma endosymbiont of Aspidapion aeneum]|uniref:MupG family TIM beta-alpha barrel fold protein n=1 Tax=Spiroplasma endosymbiont of Aspidapion aeneum TaxID=3066276 RepID=UPI00313E6A83